jgi:CDP-diacylglycerol--glycerol-3-phosphate 3-phosphatidyltransferase
VTGFGAVLDGVADRLGEVLYLLALWLLGAPAWLCVAGGALAMMQEYVRARAAAAGMTEIGVVTVWERATRIVVTAFALGVAGLAGLVEPGLTGVVATPGRTGVGATPGLTGVVALVGALAWTVLGAVGCAQLLVVARRRLD